MFRELAYGTTNSLPSMPSHFLLIHKNIPWSEGYERTVLPWMDTKNELQITLVVRGTKHLSDVIADTLLELTDYRSGKAHSGILASGKALVERYTPKLKELLKHSGRDHIRLYIVGHSLGAGKNTEYHIILLQSLPLTNKHTRAHTHTHSYPYSSFC
jgi:hypothetical protein